MTRIVYLISLLFMTSFSFAQHSYTRGSVVRNNGDTLRGWIKYGNWEVNPERIDFKTDSLSPSFTTYSVEDIGYFEVTGMDAYKRATVTKDMRIVDPMNITYETPDSTATVTAFLRMLVIGKKLSLYQLIDSKAHYYLEPAGDTIRELTYKLVFTVDNNHMENSQVRVLDIYKMQLRSFAEYNISSSLDWQIEHGRYTESGLSRIVLALNGQDSRAKTYGEANRTLRRKLRFFIGAGLAFSTFSVKGDGVAEPTVGMHFKSYTAPLFFGGMDIPSPRNFNDFTIRFEASFYQTRFTGEQDKPNTSNTLTQHDYYTLQYYTISPSLSFLYNFNRLKKTKFFVGLGMGFNFSSYSTDRYKRMDPARSYLDIEEDRHLDPKKLWIVLPARAGMKLGSKLEIAAIADLFGAFTDYSYFNTKPRTYMLKCAWFF